MPHLIVEYSANLEGPDMDGLADTLYEAALETGIFPKGGIRVRFARRDRYRISDLSPDNAFIHVLARIGVGRTLAVKKQAGGLLFKALKQHMAARFESGPLALSLHIQEIDPDLSFKHSNLHDYVARRQA